MHIDKIGNAVLQHNRNGNEKHFLVKGSVTDEFQPLWTVGILQLIHFVASSLVIREYQYITKRIDCIQGILKWLPCGETFTIIYRRNM